jgi:hypothetical protein
VLSVRSVKDQTIAGNVISPNPSYVSFTLTGPLGTTYNFDSGLPSDVRLFGNAVIETNASVGVPSGSSYLSLTDATRTQNGAALFTTRHDIDQVHIKFKTRISDTGASVITDQPWGDGFSLNIAPVLPLGTFANPQFGYSPVTPGAQLSIYFNTHANSDTQPAEIGVSLNNQVLTNILVGVNGIASNGIPSISSADGHWTPVDINIHRDGTLYLAYDGVVLLTNYPTPWVGINSAVVNFGLMIFISTMGRGMLAMSGSPPTASSAARFLRTVMSILSRFQPARDRLPISGIKMACPYPAQRAAF